MKCDKCGTELLKGNTIEAATDVVHSDSRCIDAVRAQLATMTKRAEAAEAKWAKVEECLAKDSWSQVNAKAAMYDAAEAKLATAERERNNAIVDAAAQTSNANALVELLDAAEAKLATAVKTLKIIDATDDENSIAAQAMRSVANGALRALGIDPSKEQGK